MEHTIQASALTPAWLSSFPNVAVLSLDCFDTLFWRKVASPADVFYTLAKSSEYREAGLTAYLRTRAESSARANKLIRAGTTEVTLEEIYQAALPNASPKQIAELCEQEILSEIAHGFIFQPIVELLRYAKQSGLRTIVVSDIYFSEKQLKSILFSTMPELDALIDDVFCSATYGYSKANGLFVKVMERLKVKPSQITHLGDNPAADLDGARQYGLHGTCLVQQCSNVSNMLEGRHQAAVQLLPELRQIHAIPSYFHGMLAQRNYTSTEEIIGYASVGPVLYAFADFILQELGRIRQQGRIVKVGFLLRDGYLPAKACEALFGEEVGGFLNISRFTAVAAALDSEDKILKQVAEKISPDNMGFLARQFLLPSDLTDRIIAKARRAERPMREFANLIRQKETLNVILSNSRQFRQRLIKHIQRVTGVQSGDTLMFIDLGYSGTAQTQLQQILKDDLNIDLIGRYLLAAEVPEGQKFRKGLIDPSWADNRIISALTSYIAALEMVCTQNAPSTIGYDDGGMPVFADTALPPTQHAVVSTIQQACLDFIKDYATLAPCHRPRREEMQMAHGAAIDLARMLYFPTSSEITCLQAFQFDVNLGTDMKMALFDLEEGITGMRRQGFGYMNEYADNMRTNYPMELRHLDISLSTLLFAQNRYNFKLVTAKSSYRTEQVPVLIASSHSHSSSQLTAYGTHDGFYSLVLPLSNHYNVAALVGQRYAWMQIDTLQLVEKEAMHNASDLILGKDVLFDQMAHQGNGLYALEAGAMIYLPVATADVRKYVCRLTFRPIAHRFAHAPAPELVS
ncbi:HAD family hydrolase [Noviherbaspirillum malthae]|uniref:HAD family hydrolase n=1 Tax=Noviherbaspirillum malthae TaxID=1260987 RepID=UPI0018905A71|nr:HAD family hydrolase [Noviherbaspirillum malthae]